MSHSRSTKVVALSIGQTLTQVVGLLTSAVLARLLTMQDLATYRQALLAYAFAAPLLTLALPQALYWFLPRSKNREKQVMLENLLLLGLMGLIFSMFLLYGGRHLLAMRFNNPALEHSLAWIIPYPLFMLPASALSACLVSMGKIATLSVFNVISRFALGVLLIGVCLANPNPDGLLFANVVVAGLSFLVAMRLMFNACPGSIDVPSSRRLLEMAKYSVPIGLATMLGTITLQMDKVIVSSMCSPEAFAIYSNGALELPLIGIITGSISTVILADMSKLVSEGRPGAALNLFRKATVRSAVIVLPSMVFLLAVAPVFIKLLFSIKYAESTLPFCLYLLMLPARIVYYGVALKSLGMNKVILTRSLVELAVNASLSVILVDLFGYLGAMSATLITVYCFSLPFNLSAIRKGFGTSWKGLLPVGDLSRILVVTLFPGGLALLPLLIKGMPMLLQLATASLLYWPPVLFGLHKLGLLGDSIVALQRFATRLRPWQTSSGALASKE